MSLSCCHCWEIWLGTCFSKVDWWSKSIWRSSWSIEQTDSSFVKRNRLAIGGFGLLDYLIFFLVIEMFTVFLARRLFVVCMRSSLIIAWIDALVIETLNVSWVGSWKIPSLGWMRSDCQTTLLAKKYCIVLSIHWPIQLKKQNDALRRLWCSYLISIDQSKMVTSLTNDLEGEKKKESNTDRWKSNEHSLNISTRDVSKTKACTVHCRCMVKGWNTLYLLADRQSSLRGVQTTLSHYRISSG